MLSLVTGKIPTSHNNPVTNEGNYKICKHEVGAVNSALSRVFPELIRIENCNKPSGIFKICQNTDCDAYAELKEIIYHCFNGYCGKCVDCRLRRAYARLILRFKKINSKRLVHVVIGFPKSELEERDRKLETKVMFEFYKQFKKDTGYDLNSVRVFDLHLNPMFYSHYHHALLPLPEHILNARVWQNVRRKVMQKLKVNFVVKIKGYKDRKNLLWYMSKRIAGIYDDGENTERFLLSDRMEIKTYHENFYRIRRVVWLNSLRISCKSLVPKYFGLLCPGCKQPCIISFERTIPSKFAESFSEGSIYT